MTSTARPVCLITGAATGIGAACARTFASHGWDVGVCSLDDDTRPAADAVAVVAIRKMKNTFLNIFDRVHHPRHTRRCRCPTFVEEQ